MGMRAHLGGIDTWDEDGSAYGAGSGSPAGCHCLSWLVVSLQFLRRLSLKCAFRMMLGRSRLDHGPLFLVAGAGYR